MELSALNRVNIPLRPLCPRYDAKQILHVVADLVRDHVGLGELAALASYVAATETPLEILKECGVEIDLLIVRTVERTHGGLRKPACRARCAREHNQRRRLVSFPSLRKDLLPLDLRASEHSRYELTHLIGWSFRFGIARGGLCLLLRAAQARQNLRPTDQVERIDAQRPAYETEQDDGANTDAAGATHRKAARSIPAPILNIVAARQFIQPHDLPLRGFVHDLPRLRQLRQRRKPTMGGQLVDKPRKSLRQLSDEFFFGET